MTEMDERNDEAKVPREPWKRLLEDPADGPPETTDARIRAAARRDLTPRGQRWWIPASLAASLVLAVIVVRSEIGSGGRLPIAMTERGGDAAMDARIIDRNEGEQAREPGESAAAASPQRSKQRETAESDAYGYADSEPGQEDAGTGPLVGGPERELKSASERPEEQIQLEVPAPAARERADLAKAERPSASIPAGAAAATPPTVAPTAAAKTRMQEKDLGQVVVTASRKPESPPSSWTPKHVAAPVDNVKPKEASSEDRIAGFVESPKISLPPPATPEAWYAEIERLRSQGRTADADRELERLKKKYPGWLEEHLKKEKPP